MADLRNGREEVLEVDQSESLNDLRGLDVYDLDQDGYDDLILNISQVLYIYWGSTEGLSTNSDTLQSLGFNPAEYTDRSWICEKIVKFIDLNTDGFKQLIIDCSSNDSNIEESSTNQTWTLSFEDRSLSFESLGLRNILGVPSGSYGPDYYDFGDLNGDGYLDVITASDDLIFALGRDTGEEETGAETGTFREARVIPTLAFSADRLLVHDFDHDGYDDLIAFNSTPNAQLTSRIYFGDKDEPLRRSRVFEMPLSVGARFGDLNCLLTDIDQDTYQDVVCESHFSDNGLARYSTSVSYGQANGYFQLQSNSEQNLFIMKNLVIYENKAQLPQVIFTRYDADSGEHSLQVRRYLTSYGPISEVLTPSAQRPQLVVQDFDQNGLPDFASSLGGAELVVAYNFGDGDFNNEALLRLSAQSPVDGLLSFDHLLHGDVNQDGLVDLLTITSNNGTLIDAYTTIFYNQGTAGFSSPVINRLELADLSPEIGAAKLVHFNDDEYLDLVLYGTARGEVSVLLGEGNGTFSFLDSKSIQNNSIANPIGNIMETLDYDQDGDLDLIIYVKIGFSNQIHWLENLGGGELAEALRISDLDGREQVYSLDLDEDGIHDLITYDGATLYFKTNSDQLTYDLPEYFEGITQVDLDSDDDQDLVVTVSDFERPYYLYLLQDRDETGRLLFRPLDTMQAGGYQSEWLDLNRDGKLDNLSIYKDLFDFEVEARIVSSTSNHRSGLLQRFNDVDLVSCPANQEWIAQPNDFGTYSWVVPAGEHCRIDQIEIELIQESSTALNSLIISSPSQDHLLLTPQGVEPLFSGRLTPSDTIALSFLEGSAMSPGRWTVSTDQAVSQVRLVINPSLTLPLSSDPTALACEETSSEENIQSVQPCYLLEHTPVVDQIDFESLSKAYSLQGPIGGGFIEGQLLEVDLTVDQSIQGQIELELIPHRGFLPLPWTEESRTDEGKTYRYLVPAEYEMRVLDVNVRSNQPFEDPLSYSLTWHLD